MLIQEFNDSLRLARAAPVGDGRVDFLINRPSEGVHVPAVELYMDVDKGIVGDRWAETAWLRLADGRPDPRVQVSLTNTSVMQCFAGAGPDGVFGCGDNIYTNLNITEYNLPVGTRLQMGGAVLEVSAIVNDGCGKFAQRFGAEAFKLVRRPENLSLRLRGIFCSIKVGGVVRVNDLICVKAS